MKVITILAGLLIGSIAYHLNVDNETLLGMPSYQVSWICMSLGALVGALLISIFSKEKTSRVALLIFVGIILSIIGHMAYDISFTSRQHKLAPFELVVYSILSLPTAFAGAYLGRIVARWKKS